MDVDFSLPMDYQESMDYQERMYELMRLEYKETERVVLFNTCHGELPVHIRSTKGKSHNIEYVTTYVPAINLNRLIKAPTATCSVTSKVGDRQFLSIMRDICLPYINSEKFFNDDDFMQSCKEELIPVSLDLKSQTLPENDKAQTRKTGKISSGIITQSISKSKKTFEYVKSNQGEQIKNKIWTSGNNLGIFIILPVKFKLPYIPTGVTGILFPELATRPEYNVYPRHMFSHLIGRVSTMNGEYYIKYDEGANLLTCPYFIEYVLLHCSHISDIRPYLKMCETMENQNKQMLTEVNAIILYSYFQHVPTINHIDTSCEAMDLKHIPENTERILSQEEMVQIVGHLPTAKLQRLMSGHSITGEVIGRGRTSKNKRKRKSHQTKSKQKKSRKPRK